MANNAIIDEIRERLNLKEKLTLYLLIAGVVLLLFIIILMASNRASSGNAYVGNLNCPQGGCMQASPVALACPPGGCIRANPVALACPPGSCIRANPVALACPPGGCIRANPVAFNQGNNGRFISGGQYYCTHCQHMGLPEFDRDGTPRCPICGEIMKVNCGSANQNAGSGAP